MRTVIIDNYDSFTYNLAHLLREEGSEVEVFRNDKFKMPQLETFDRIVLSPGPGIPSEAGLLLDVIQHYAGHKPMLGVCLGHQAIGQVFGAQLENLSDVYHGVESQATVVADDVLFSGMPPTITVGRYHSWVVSRKEFPDCLQVTAISPDGAIMALRHKQLDIRGIQFHPESILTPQGHKIIHNWLTDN